MTILLYSAWLLVSRPVTARRSRAPLFPLSCVTIFTTPRPPGTFDPPESCAPLSPFARTFPYKPPTPFHAERYSCRSESPESILLTPSASTAAERQTHTPRSSMLLMDSARRAGCSPSPVCLDLSVGLSPSSPGSSGPETTADTDDRLDRPAAGCRVASSLSDEQVTGCTAGWLPSSFASSASSGRSSLTLSVV